MATRKPEGLVAIAKNFRNEINGHTAAIMEAQDDIARLRRQVIVLDESIRAFAALFTAKKPGLLRRAWNAFKETREFDEQNFF